MKKKMMITVGALILTAVLMIRKTEVQADDQTKVPQPVGFNIVLQSQSDIATLQDQTTGRGYYLILDTTNNQKDLIMGKNLVVLVSTNDPDVQQTYRGEADVAVAYGTTQNRPERWKLGVFRVDGGGFIEVSNPKKASKIAAMLNGNGLLNGGKPYTVSTMVTMGGITKIETVQGSLNEATGLGLKDASGNALQSALAADACAATCNNNAQCLANCRKVQPLTVNTKQNNAPATTKNRVKKKTKKHVKPRYQPTAA